MNEKLTILTADQNSMLKRRDELLETCRHWRKHLLVSIIKEKRPAGGAYAIRKRENTSKTFPFSQGLTKFQYQIRFQFL